MSSKKTFVLALICVALFALVAYSSYLSAARKHIEEALQQKVAEIEAQYIENQDLIQSIVQAFWEDDTIDAIRVNPFEDGHLELWLSDGKTDAFEEDYPQLYDAVYQLWTSDFYTPDLSRSGDHIVYFTTHGQQYDGIGTEFSLSFYADPPEALPSDYFKQFSDNCWLVVKNFGFV